MLSDPRPAFSIRAFVDVQCLGLRISHVGPESQWAISFPSPLFLLLLQVNNVGLQVWGAKFRVEG